MRSSPELGEAIARIRVIDAHCHPFVLEAAGGELAAQFTLSEEPLDQRSVTSTLLVRRLVRDLAAFLGCSPDLDSVAAARSRAFTDDRADDRHTYSASLFRDAGIELLMCDVGHPVTSDELPAVDIGAFSDVVATPCRTVFRIDSVVDRLMLDPPPFDEFMDRLTSAVNGAAEDGAVAFKSVIAYRTGLDVERVDREAAQRSFDAFVHDPTSADSKPLHDSLFVWGLEAAIRHDLPMQVHTGMGDGPVFDLTTARPALLRRLLFDQDLRQAKIVLTHAGYPWVEESGWLANQYDNVFIDISEMVPFATNGVSRKLLGLLELAPTSKLLYGSDGFNVPEMHWFGAHMARRALTQALVELLIEGWIDEDEALDIAEGILRRNAIDLYRLDMDPTGPRRNRHR